MINGPVTTPLQLRPYPADQRSIKPGTKKRAVIRAQILTASPYRKQLVDWQEKAQSTTTHKRSAKSLSLQPAKKQRKKSQPATDSNQLKNNAVDNTPCRICEIPYSESHVNWFKCSNCCSWICGTCDWSVQKNSLALTASRTAIRLCFNIYIAGSYVFKQESNELNVKLGAVIN